MHTTSYIDSNSLLLMQFWMPREKKIPKSYRLSPLAVSLVQAEMKDREASGTSRSEADIIEECIYKRAMENPEYRERILEELHKDPRFAAFADSLQPEDRRRHNLAGRVIPAKSRANVETAKGVASPRSRKSIQPLS